MRVVEMKKKKIFFGKKFFSAASIESQFRFRNLIWRKWENANRGGYFSAIRRTRKKLFAN